MTRYQGIFVGGVVLLTGCISLSAPKTETPVSVASNRLSSALPAPQVIFEPNLKLKGGVLNTKVTCRSASNCYVVADIVLQSLVTKYEHNVRPFPQHDISDIEKTDSRLLSFPTSSAATLSGSNSFSWKNLDLKQKKLGDDVSFVRIKAVVAQGLNDPKNWTKVDSTTFFSPWMPYSPVAKR